MAQPKLSSTLSKLTMIVDKMARIPREEWHVSLLLQCHNLAIVGAELSADELKQASTILKELLCVARERAADEVKEIELLASKIATAQFKALEDRFYVCGPGQVPTKELVLGLQEIETGYVPVHEVQRLLTQLLMNALKECAQKQARCVLDYVSYLQAHGGPNLRHMEVVVDLNDLPVAFKNHQTCENMLRTLHEALSGTTQERRLVKVKPLFEGPLEACAVVDLYRWLFGDHEGLDIGGLACWLSAWTEAFDSLYPFFVREKAQSLKSGGCVNIAVGLEVWVRGERSQ